VGIVLGVLKPEITKTVKELDAKTFEPDPIAGKHFSKITSIMSSAYKRHGYILERAILEAASLNPDWIVWREEAFAVPSAVDHIVSASISSPSRLLGTEFPYSTPADRHLQVDLIIYDKKTGATSAYEVKRGFGLHDAGKRRSMMRDTLAVQILLKSYVASRGFVAASAASHVIFYYGKCSLPKPFAISGAELDTHLGFPVHSEVEAVNTLYQSELFSILAGS
jgi:hypothetical protein